MVCGLHYGADKMEQVFNMYQGMESNKETCRDIVEQIFFPPLWPNLVQLYRYVDHSCQAVVIITTGVVIIDKKWH